MLHVYKTLDELVQVDLGEKGAWIHLVNPSESELQQVSEQTGLLPEFLRAALDEEERSRIDAEDDQLLLLINIPLIRQDADLTYDTIPLGIVVGQDVIATICLEPNPIFDEITTRKPRGFSTLKRTRFVLQILFRTATQYLRYLKQIDKKSNELERQVHNAMTNAQVIELLNLEKSMVYFTTSLRSNEIVMEKLLRSWNKPDPESAETSKFLRMYQDDVDLLEDVITENKQAIEMCEVYSNILSGMMDAFASLISNNLNIVMKLLASVTIVLAVPTIIASFYGMNVPLPFERSPYAFAGVMAISLLSTLGAVVLMWRKRMF